MESVSAPDEDDDGIGPAGIRPSVLRPISFPEDLWDQIPPDLRQEAVDRAGWISLRNHVKTTHAVRLALSGMEADLQLLEFGVEPPWNLVSALMKFAPTPRRDRDGHVDPDIMELASRIEQDARWAYREGMTGIPSDPGRRYAGDMAANRSRLMMERVFELVSIYGVIEDRAVEQ